MGGEVWEAAGWVRARAPVAAIGRGLEPAGRSRGAAGCRGGGAEGQGTGRGRRERGAGREAVARPAPSQVHGWRLPGWGRCPAHAPQTPGWPPDLLLPGWLRAGCLTTR